MAISLASLLVFFAPPRVAYTMAGAGVLTKLEYLILNQDFPLLSKILTAKDVVVKFSRRRTRFPI